MKRILLCYLLVGAGFLTYYQTDLISSGGNSEVNASGILSFSVGELAIPGASENQFRFREGFHHVTITVERLVNGTAPERLTDVRVFPNPTARVLTIRRPIEMNELTYDLHGFNGSIILGGVLKPGQAEQSIDFSSINSASYLIS